MSGQRPEAWKGQEGFALILALLSLLVLTFLGLTLAATTSTELQIANNYRWGQQAAYNAEAGLEVAKIYLRAVPVDWATVLPAVRTGNWDPSTGTGGTGGGTPTPPVGYAGTAAATRNWENSGCDNFGSRAGYGLVLSAVMPGSPTDLQDVSQVLGYSLNGAFTVWIRRPLTFDKLTGKLYDEPSPSQAILVAEGVAPRANLPNAARRVIELRVQGASFDCESLSGMSGAGQGGAGFATCRHFQTGCGAAASVAGAFSGRSTDSSKAFSTQTVGTLCDTGKN